MTIDDQIRDEKLQYNNNREAVKISALSSNNFNKYEYLTGKEILSSNQKQMIQQARFAYSPLRKAFEKQIKTIEGQGKKQIDALKDLKESEKKTKKKQIHADTESKNRKTILVEKTSCRFS